MMYVCYCWMPKMYKAKTFVEVWVALIPLLVFAPLHTLHRVLRWPFLTGSKKRWIFFTNTVSSERASAKSSP